MFIQNCTSLTSYLLVTTIRQNCTSVTSDILQPSRPKTNSRFSTAAWGFLCLMIKMSQWKLHILQDPALSGFCHFHLRSLQFVHVGIIAGRKVRFPSGGMINFVLII